MGQDAERVFEYDKVFHLSHKEPIRIDTLPRKKRGKSKNMEIDFRTWIIEKQTLLLRNYDFYKLIGHRYGGYERFGCDIALRE